jgi:hypothetical protein
MNTDTSMLTNMPTGARSTPMNISMFTLTGTGTPIHMREAALPPATITPAITVRISMTIKIILPSRIIMRMHEAR